MIPIGGAVILAAVGAARFVLARQGSDPSSGTMRGISLAMAALMVVMFGLSLQGIRQPARSRPAFDLGRAVFSLAAVVLMGSITKASAVPPLLVVALIVGAVVGMIEGSVSRVIRGSDGRRYAHRAILPLAASFAGLLVGVLAAVGDARSTLQAGQLVGMVGVGLMLGVALIRSRPVRPAPQLAAMALVVMVVGAALLGGLLGGGIRDARAQEPKFIAADGKYGGKVELDPAQASKYFEYQLNEVDLTLSNERLSGTIRLSSSDNLNGKHYCGYSKYTLAGAELKVGARTKSSFTLNGAVRWDENFQETTEETCDKFSFRDKAKSETLDLVVTTDRISGRMGKGNLNATLTERALSTGTGSPSTPGTEPMPPVAIDPNAPKMSSEEPISPANTTDAAILVVIALAGSGAISVAQAEGARKALEGGAVPQDVIDELARKSKFGKLGGIEALGIPTAEQTWREAQNVLNAFPSTKTVSSSQYTEWLKKLEGTLPNATWPQIVAAMHHNEFGTDVNRKLPGFDIRLFENGPSTDGYLEIMPWLGAGAGRNASNGLVITNTMPKWVIDGSGNRVDITHALAGLRSDLNRPPGYIEQVFQGGGWQVDGPAGRNFMRWANTHGGDSWQVIVNAGGSSVDHGQARLAWEYAPPDQRLGNDVGIWLSDFYRNPANGNVPLSDAMGRFFHTTGGNTSTRSSYY